MLAFFSEPKPAHGLPDLAAPLTSTTYFSFWGRQAQEVICSPSQGKLLKFSVVGHLHFSACWLLQKTTRSLLFRLSNYTFIRAHWWWGENWYSPYLLPYMESRMVISQMERCLIHSLLAKHGFGYVGSEKCSVETEKLVSAQSPDLWRREKGIITFWLPQICFAAGASIFMA